MTPRPPLNCALCDLAIWNEPPTVWSPPPNREPYCDEGCYATARAIDHAIPPAVDRAVRRDHSLCGAEPCSHCR
jgi:hypothetical protein